ncbi:helix-turn-helix domain-containing protein [Massilia horti]|uniref:Helix-turn-helix domain-containing protein n=1 Tax=Massilia horti TaxID=2562153 RepID=A0A4Y9SPW6_9BURK|nr:helix-turn-helix domain-containing protein [Massilia horti]TFW28598.1 helix-turn-helix domain-containing protein [Massilia horti]
MTSERADQPVAPEQQHHGIPGQALAAQREAMGWTVEQVADQLKLAVRQVVALEAGDYASLPSPAVTRGFVRAYAKILKMDAAPLVAMIEMEAPEAAATSPVRREAKPTTFSEVRFSPGGKRTSLPFGWIAGAAVVVIVAAAAWHFGVEKVGHPAEPADNGASASTALPAPVSESPASAHGGSSPEPLQNTSVPLISVPSASATAPEAPATTAPAAAPAAAPAVAAATVTAVPAAAPAAAAGDNELVFTVREDSWISVAPVAGGKPLLSQLIKAGSTEKVNVTEPVKVVVGNAPGVSATLRGAAVDLPGKTARISLK